MIRRTDTGQRKGTKRLRMVDITLHIKLKIEQHERH